MPLKVCYIDDEVDLLELFVDLYSTPNRSITTFHDWEKAIDYLKSNKQDIIFIDYRLQRITGDKLAEKLDIETPKVLITGDMEVRTVYPFFAFFPKPFREEEIERILQLAEKKAV